MPAGEGRTGAELSLVFSDPNGKPVVFSLPEGTTTVGRARDNDLVLDDESVEPHQIILQRDGERLEMRDLFAGETRINDEVRHNGEVRPGDVLRLGGLRLRVMKVAPSRHAQRASSRGTRPLGRRAQTDEPPTQRSAQRAKRPTDRVQRETDDSRLARERDARRARSLARTRQVADELMVQDDFEVILEQLATGFLEVFMADRAVTVLFEEDGRNPLLVVERRRDGTAEGAGVAQEIIDRCLQVRSVIRVAGGLEGLGGLAAPLITEGRALGLLYFERNVSQGHPLGADDVHLMALLANVAALKIAPLVL